MDRVLALHAGSRGFDSHRGHMSERFFRSNRPGYPHPVSSELENSGIRVAVGDCSVTERRRWGPPYQTGKTVHVHAKHCSGRTHGAGCVRQWFRTTRGTSLRELEYTQDRGNLGIIFHISPYKMLWFLIKTLLPILELLVRFSVFHRLPYSVKVITQKV